MKRIHILENALRYLLDEGRNAEKAKQKTIAVMKNYLSQNGVQGEQLEAMAMEYEHSFKEWLFHANMPDSIIRIEPIMANVAMQLGFTPKDRDTRELYRLKDITNYIIANYNKDDFPIALNKLTLDNTSFDSLNELFGSAMDSSKGSWKPSNNGKSKPHYTVKHLDTFEEAHEYYPYTQDICYLGNRGTWNDYTDNGKNAVYVLLRDGWEDIPAEHGEDTPYDEYGESMVFVIIRPDSKVAYTNTRWNHETEGNGPIDVDQSFTENMGKISDMLQTDYRNVLKPYTEEEMVKRGVITLSMLRRWISEGKDILTICKHSRQITTDLFRIDLFSKSIVLYNFHMNKLMPSDEFTLQEALKAHEERIAIQREDGKWSFINTEGEQISNWYRYVGGFYDGYAIAYIHFGKYTFINTKGQEVFGVYNYAESFEEGYAIVRQNASGYTFINTEGQQICGWYRNVDSFHNGFAQVKREDGKWSFINTKGQEIGGWHEEIYDFSEGLAVVHDNNKFAFINTNGQQISEWYSYIRKFHNGFAQVKREDGKWSYINTKGQQIGDWYDNTYDFTHNGFAVVGNNDKESCINVKGQQICGWYDRVNNFHNGFCTVVKGLHSYYMDTNGNLYDFDTMKPISPQNESYLRLNNLIAETLQKSIRNYLLYN